MLDEGRPGTKAALGHDTSGMDSRSNGQRALAKAPFSLSFFAFLVEQARS